MSKSSSGAKLVSAIDSDERCCPCSGDAFLGLFGRLAGVAG